MGSYKWKNKTQKTSFPLIKTPESMKLSNHDSAVTKCMEVYILHPDEKGNSVITCYSLHAQYNDDFKS